MHRVAPECARSTRLQVRRPALRWPRALNVSGSWPRSPVWARACKRASIQRRRRARHSRTVYRRDAGCPKGSTRPCARASVGQSPRATSAACRRDARDRPIYAWRAAQGRRPDAGQPLRWVVSPASRRTGSRESVSMYRAPRASKCVCPRATRTGSGRDLDAPSALVARVLEPQPSAVEARLERGEREAGLV